MSDDAFMKRRQAFEEEFFNKENQKLKDKLRAELEKKHTRDELVALTGVEDTQVLDALMALNVDKGTFAAFALLPLIEVAWADGKVDDKERAGAAGCRRRAGNHAGERRAHDAPGDPASGRRARTRSRPGTPGSER